MVGDGVSAWSRDKLVCLTNASATPRLLLGVAEKIPDPLDMSCVSAIPDRWICTRCMVEMTGAEARCKQPTCRLSFRVCGIPASNTSSAQKSGCKPVSVPTAHRLRTNIEPLLIVDAAAKPERVPFSPRGQCPPSAVDKRLPTAFVTPPSKQVQPWHRLSPCIQLEAEESLHCPLSAEPDRLSSQPEAAGSPKRRSAPNSPRREATSRGAEVSLCRSKDEQKDHSDPLVVGVAEHVLDSPPPRSDSRAHRCSDAVDGTSLSVESAQKSCHSPCSWSDLLQLSDTDFEAEIAKLYDAFVS